MRDEVMRRMELELDSRRDEIRALRAKVEAYKKGYEDQVALTDRHEAGYRETIAQLQTQLSTLTAENNRLREALEHCEKVFRSMSDRGAYPSELLPFSTNPLTPHADNPHYLGKQGFRFLIDALRGEGG